MDLHHAELAFRRQYQDLLLAGRITAVFRPGIRVPPKRDAFAVGDVVTARVMERRGCHRLGLPPVFNDIRIPVQITRLEVMTIDGLRDEDFEGSLPDVRDKETLREHLADLSDQPVACIGSAVTRIQFRYI